MSEHSPEPWRLDDGGNPLFIYDADKSEFPEGNHVAELPSGLHESARRIVACVNACRGIPTEELEAKAVDLSAGHVYWACDVSRLNGLDPNAIEQWADMNMRALKQKILQQYNKTHGTTK